MIGPRWNVVTEAARGPRVMVTVRRKGGWLPLLSQLDLLWLYPSTWTWSDVLGLLSSRSFPSLSPAFLQEITHHSLQYHVSCASFPLIFCLSPTRSVMVSSSPGFNRGLEIKSQQLKLDAGWQMLKCCVFCANMVHDLGGGSVLHCWSGRRVGERRRSRAPEVTG
jgi:hypothetical protein